MNYKELDNLITFKMGVPSLYHIMLGMSSDETEEYQTALDEMNTDNYDLNDFLMKCSNMYSSSGRWSSSCINRQ